MASFRTSAIEAIRAQVGDGRVICGLSGGVDSSVVAVLLHEAIGAQLTCVFVDTGLMRQGEAEEVTSLFRRHYNIPLVHEDARAVFLKRLAGITEPEEKRKIIGATFIDVFEAGRAKRRRCRLSGSGDALPGRDRVRLRQRSERGHQVPPQRGRAAGAHEAQLGRAASHALQGRGAGARSHSRDARRELTGRHPFPGPGLAIRIPGGVTEEKVAILQQGRCDPDRGNSQRRPLRRHLAGFRGAAAGTDGWREGRCAHLRACLRAPCRHVGRLA